jgi:hypothetical protein
VRLNTQEIAETMGHLRPDERVQLESALKAVDEEEARIVRLAAAGKITESVWDSLWHEWQDRRRNIRSTLEALKHPHQTHITNSEWCIILYNTLERSDQQELLRQMVERVVVNRQKRQSWSCTRRWRTCEIS